MTCIILLMRSRYTVSLTPETHGVLRQGYLPRATKDGHRWRPPPAAGRLPVAPAFCPRGLFGDWGGGGGQAKDGDSKLNKGEAARVLDVLEEILNAGELKVENVGVVTPYVAQVRC